MTETPPDLTALILQGADLLAEAADEDDGREVYGGHDWAVASPDFARLLVTSWRATAERHRPRVAAFTAWQDWCEYCRNQPWPCPDITDTVKVAEHVVTALGCAS